MLWNAQWSTARIPLEFVFRDIQNTILNTAKDSLGFCSFAAMCASVPVIDAFASKASPSFATSSS